jgi:hypothetical protein
MRQLLLSFLHLDTSSTSLLPTLFSPLINADMGIWERGRGVEIRQLYVVFDRLHGVCSENMFGVGGRGRRGGLKYKVLLIPNQCFD